LLKIVFHQAYMTRYYTSVAESPYRVKAIYNRLKDHYPTVTPRPATREDLLRAHTDELIQKVQQEGRETYQTALLAAGGALCAARLAVFFHPAFAVIRPPGHHAGRNQFGRFCFFNNMAIAVKWLLDKRFIRRVIIVDFDMHSADGTRAVFAEHPGVAVIDIWAKDRKLYLEILQTELARAEPADLIAVSAGFDLYVQDWGGILETADFHQIGLLIHRTALEKARGRYFGVLEGGYYLNDLGKNALAFCQGLEGRDGASAALPAES
jgi:acetoin utilization deacetylase AcuC-like enzyme